MTDPGTQNSRDWAFALAAGLIAGTIAAGLLALLGWHDTIPQGLVALGMWGNVPFFTLAGHAMGLPDPSSLSGLVVQNGWRVKFDVISILSGLGGGVAGYWVGEVISRPLQPQQVRGRTVQSARAARAALAQEAGREGADAELAPGIRLPADRTTAGTLIQGGVGSGKTTLLRYLLRSLLADPSAKILIRDAKGDFSASLLNRADATLLAPWDTRGLAWDVAQDVRTRADAQAFCQGLIPDGGDPIWSSGAREILLGLVVDLQRVAPEGRWGFSHLAQALGWPYPALRAHAISGNPLAAQLLPEEPSKTTQSFLANLVAFCAPIFDLADAWGADGHGGPVRSISMRRWVREDGYGPRVLILQGNAAQYQVTSDALTRAVLAGIRSTIGPDLTDDKNRKRWLILDEFPQVGRVNDIANILEMGRSKGIRAVLAWQDVAQIREIYSHDIADAWSSMTGGIVFLRSGASGAAWASEIIGQAELKMPTLTRSAAGTGQTMTTTYQHHETDVVTASEISALGRDGAGISGLYLPIGGVAGKAVYRLSVPFTSDRDLGSPCPAAPACLLAPWTAPGWPSSAAQAQQVRAAEIADEGHGDHSGTPAPDESRQWRDSDDLAPQPVPVDAPIPPPMSGGVAAAVEDQVDDAVGDLAQDHVVEVVVDHLAPGMGHLAAEVVGMVSEALDDLPSSSSTSTTVVPGAGRRLVLRRKKRTALDQEMES